MPAPAATLDELLEQLREQGERVTMARRAVLQELLDAPDAHLTVEALAERISRRYPEIHLSTVYRTVEFLAQRGILAEVRAGTGPSSYHFAADSHHHAVCDVCGTELELPPGLFEPVAERLRVELGFAASPSHLMITGVCAGCQAATP